MKTLFIVASMGLIGGEARAQPPEPEGHYYPDRLAGWRFELEPFAVLPVSLSGTAAVGDRSVPVDASAGDILSDLDFALTGRIEAWKQRWGLIGNFQRYWMSSANEVARMSTSLDSRLALGSALVARRFGAFDIEDRLTASVDVEAGVWLARIHNTIDVGDGLSREASATFAKAALAARPIVRITPSLAVISRDSVTFPDVSWVVSLGGEYDYRFLGFELGYWVERIVLTENRASIAATTHGPYLAVALRWGAGRPY